jgi:transposase-like protein
MTGQSTMSKRRIMARQHEADGLALRKSGATYEAIARDLGVSVQSAHRAVKRALERLNGEIAESVTDVRRMELERLDAMLGALCPKAARGNLTAVDRVLHIMERRAKLLGLDTPSTGAENYAVGVAVQVNLTDALASQVQAIPETLRAEFTDILMRVRRAMLTQRVEGVRASVAQMLPAPASDDEAP